jgi:uncharacterized surface protein with fasciclin (FAS1) repeats
LRKTQRLLSVAAIAAATISMAACSSSEQASPQQGGGGAADKPAANTGAGSAMSGSGTTTAKDVFGPGCAAVPKSGEGSVGGMVDDPVGTAASHNPLLKTLVKAATAADLVPTLNDTNASYTVFAPADSAFAKIPPKTLQGLLKPSAKKQLADLLTYHVVPQRLDKDGAEQMKELTPVGGGGAKLKIGGSGDNMTVTDGSGATAKVLCGNVPTKNATVFVIDSVLMPKKM